RQARQDKTFDMKSYTIPEAGLSGALNFSGGAIEGTINVSVAGAGAAQPAVVNSVVLGQFNAGGGAMDANSFQINGTTINIGDLDDADTEADMATVISAINAQSHLTGVSASENEDGDGIVLTDYSGKD